MSEFDYLSFRLPETFLDHYKRISPKWGFAAGPGNSLGEYAWLTKYSRKKADGTRERYWEGIRRVIEGMYSIQKDYALSVDDGH
jgi:ribonucleoside-triphosphate reductase